MKKITCLVLLVALTVISIGCEKKAAPKSGAGAPAAGSTSGTEEKK